MTHLAAMADWSRFASDGLVAAVWQGMLLAAAVGLGLRLLPKTPAAVRFAVWFAVFLVMAGLPVTALWPHSAGAARSGEPSAWLTLDGRWSVAIAGIWLTASLLRAATLGMAAVRVRTLWKRATPVVRFGLSLPSINALAASVGCGAPGFQDGASEVFLATRRAQVCTSDEVDRPTVIGFFAPKILIPTWLLEKLTAAELEQIVLHETGHLGRADDWMNLLQKVALVAFPLNPALAWVERRLCFERELACDERVLRKTQAPKAYAACLASLAEHGLGRRGLVLALGALERESELGRRVTMILRRGETMRPSHARLILGGAMLGLLGGAAGLVRSPHVIEFSASADKTASAMTSGGTNTTHDKAAAYASNARFSNELLPVHNVLREHSLSTEEGSNPGASRKGNQRLKPQVDDNLYGTTVGISVDRADEPDFRNSLDVDLQNSGRTAMKLTDGVEVSEREVAETALNRRLIETSVQMDRQSGEAADGALEWIVMTSWQGADGSRVTLTMTTRSEAGVTAVRRQVVSDTEQPIKYVYPYAAVPVRDGWLVFQL